VDLAEWPQPHHGINLPPELQGCVGPLLAIVDFASTYSEALSLTPFGVEDLRAALLYRGASALLAELHIALLRLALPADPLAPNTDADDGPSRPKPPLVRMVRPSTEVAATLPCGAPPTLGMLSEVTWPEVCCCPLSTGPPWLPCCRDVDGRAFVSRCVQVVRWFLLWRSEGAQGDDEVADAVSAMANAEVRRPRKK
jgi:hypothetical protein